MGIVVFDLDGTLADVSSRRKELNSLLGKGVSKSKAYNWFFSNEALSLDTPNKHITEIFRLLLVHSDKKLIVLSGRPWKQRDGSLNFIKNHITQKPVEFYCRPYGESKKTDYDFKKTWITNASRLGAPIDYAFDDQKVIVDLWRESGITCFDCAGYIREN